MQKTIQSRLETTASPAGRGGLLLRRKCACESSGGKCSDCGREREGELRRSASKHIELRWAPGIVNEVLGSPGRPLDASSRAFMEPGIGRDFANVRVHTDARASNSARAVGAHAYTVGRDVVFGEGKYSPGTREGMSLLAHELTHVAQNSGESPSLSAPIAIGPQADGFEAEADARAGAVAGHGFAASPSRPITPHGMQGRLSRATFTVGPAKVQIDYANVMKATDSQTAIEAMFTTYTGSPATAIHADVDKLTLTARHWLLFALDLLVDNPVAGLDKVTAVKRLIEYAPKGRFDPQADKSPTFNFANEALSVSGWFEKGVTAGLIKPKGAMLSDVQTLINPGSSSSGSSSCPSPRAAKDQLDAAKLQSDLPGQLETYIKAYHKQITSSKNPTQPMSQLLPLADPIQEQARTYYAGYADRARGGGNTFLQQWQYSAHLASVQSPAGNPDKDKRLSYLDSRAKKVGGAGLFSTVHFDARCDADANVLDGIVQAMEKRNDIQALLDPILRQKSYTEQTATPKQVVLSPESDKDECAARWKTIKTMCHELMHVMVHPDFRRAEKGRQILTEGFPEVLGHYLYQEIKKQAENNTKVKAQMEAGLNSAPCSSIPDSTIEYKEAGKGAEDIRLKVGRERFRAAFFLGQLEMVGLQPKRISNDVSNDPLEAEAERAATSVCETRSFDPVAARGPSLLDADILKPASVNIGSGRPLEPKVRREMETRLGHDFSGVRVHTDEKAQESARRVDALAYTVGQNVVFGGGRYSPGTVSGNRLLVHELTHVIQQTNGGTRLQLRPPWRRSADPLESDALDAERGWGPDEGFGDRGWSSTMSWREAMETVPQSRPRPEAARVTDQRPRVLPTDRASYNDLQTYVAGLPARLRALVSSRAASEPWLTSANPNVQSALRVLDQLTGDLSAERFVVRFDQQVGTPGAASYDFLNDVMHLRPFSGAEQRTLITVDLLHEYTHIIQDREAEQVFVRSTTAHVHTRQEDLARETQARREQVYFGEMLRVLGEPVPTDAILGSRLSDMVFRGRFERERTAPTARERSAATREIKTEIEAAYATQLATNASIKTYHIKLTSSNRADLYMDVPGVSSPRDLGIVPAGTTTKDQLSTFLERAIRALPEYGRLAVAGGGRRFAILTFVVSFNGDLVTEFGIQL